MNDWQDISTAPKDGTPILVYVEDDKPKYVMVFWYSDDFWSGWLFVDEALADISPEGVNPTHWQLLAPPGAVMIPKQVIHDWIKHDLSPGMQMMILPEHVTALLNRVNDHIEAQRVKQ